MAENIFGITDTGRLRDNNEDAFIAQPLANKQFILACVIDGVGGYEGGEVAADLARSAFLESLQQPGPDFLKNIQAAFVTANQKIWAEKFQSGKNSNMACVATLTVADIRNNKFYYAHVGDTRLYLLRDQTLIKVTRDQSFVGFLEDSGRLPEEEAMKHPKRNEINKALGFDAQSILGKDYIETGESPFLPGDLLLLCSDGLTDMLSSTEIRSILSRKTPLEQKGKELIDAANQAGGKDNITVVLVRNHKRPVKQEVQKPVLVKKKEVEERPIPPEAPVALERKQKQPPRSGKGIIVLLCGLVLLFLGGFVWMWIKHTNTSLPTGQTKKERNAQEIRLQAYINTGRSDTILLNESTLGTSIYLSDTLWIRRDSVYIKGSGKAMLIKEKGFGKGPALVVTPQCKSIVLDSLTLEGFDIGVLASHYSALRLKNTRFVNCAISIAYAPGADSAFRSGMFIRGLNDNVPKTEN